MSKAETKVGLALGGGGARGIAHIGVLKAFAEHDIPVHYLTGVSVGSVIGSLFCSGQPWDKILDVAEEIGWDDLVKPTLSGLGIVKGTLLEQYVGKLVGDLDFESLKIPMKIIATDLASAQTVIFDSGPVGKAVHASSSIPGIFEPMIEGDRALIDGGFTNNLPSEEVREMGADKVIAVDLNADRTGFGIPDNLFEVTAQSFALLLSQVADPGREDCDVLLQPDLSKYAYHDLSDVQGMVEAGEKVAVDAMEKIKECIGA
ncbi:MAG: patatin-like phospholipase family protein [Spirochaetales bacterium]